MAIMEVLRNKIRDEKRARNPYEVVLPFLSANTVLALKSRFRDLVPIGTNVQIWSRKRPDLPLKSRGCLIGHNRTVYRSQTVKIPSGM